MTGGGLNGLGGSLFGIEEEPNQPL